MWRRPSGFWLAGPHILACAKPIQELIIRGHLRAQSHTSCVVASKKLVTHRRVVR
jgi:hypothetical protein